MRKIFRQLIKYFKKLRDKIRDLIKYDLKLLLLYGSLLGFIKLEASEKSPRSLPPLERSTIISIKQKSEVGIIQPFLL